MEVKKRLIDADLFRKEIECCDIETSNDWMTIVEQLNEAPTVDAVEVVRCKDCKHYDNSEGICWCKINSKFYPGGMDWHSFPEDGFCSYGEKK